MAENSGSAQRKALNFVDKVCSIIPNITPDLLEKLSYYLKSAGVCSEADIGKVDERQLASIIGSDDARKLLDYFKEQDLAKVNSPSTSAVVRSSAVAETFPQMLAVAGSHGGGSNVLEIILAMQKMHCEKDEKILMRMQESQEKSLNAITNAMERMGTMHTDTLGKMSEQMMEQSKMHQLNVKVMNEQIQTTTKMHGETMKAVQHGMGATQQMNADTLRQVTQSMASALEAQEKTMNEYRLSLAKRDDDNCAIM